MFPIEYPLKVIKKYQRSNPVILDPFCGRGTTIYAARKKGFKSYGIDTSPIATAIAKAKLSKASHQKVIELADHLISIPALKIPSDPFFRRAFSKKTLMEVCSLREGLLKLNIDTDESNILRAAALGCLHGPLPKTDGTNSYFSNQMPRTFASKPDYSLKYWSDNNLLPPTVSICDVLKKKISRITDLESDTYGHVDNIIAGDSTQSSSYTTISNVDLIVTSPPYYGMRTYVQDQWLRMWFLGGPSKIAYENKFQISHNGQSIFIDSLAEVWKNIRSVASDGAHLHIRFGTIPSVKSDAREIIKASLEKFSDWKLVSARTAATANAGKRQANQMGSLSQPNLEFDFHAV